jgi:hypothetical protein
MSYLSKALAVKTYDSNAVVELALAGSMEAIIPSKSNRKLPRPMDWARYIARHLVENLFQYENFSQGRDEVREARRTLHELCLFSRNREMAPLNFSTTAPNQIQ